MFQIVKKKLVHCVLILWGKIESREKKDQEVGNEIEKVETETDEIAVEKEMTEVQEGS